MLNLISESLSFVLRKFSDSLTTLKFLQLAAKSSKAKFFLGMYCRHFVNKQRGGENAFNQGISKIFAVLSSCRDAIITPFVYLENFSVKTCVTLVSNFCFYFSKFVKIWQISQMVSCRTLALLALGDLGNFSVKMGHPS